MDAKKHDIDAFDSVNTGRFALQYVPASLSLDTVHATNRTRVVWILVNDTCDAKVIEALAGMVVELIALRCSGFNNVVVSSHQALLTNEALGNIASTTLCNLEEFLGGKRGAQLSNAVPLPQET